MAEKAATEELIRVHHKLMITHRVRPGPYATIYFDELKEGRWWAIKCPKCKSLWTPPTLSCKICHIMLPEFPQHWLQISGKGYLESWYDVVETSKSSTGEEATNPYLTANFWLDEGMQQGHVVGVAPGTEEAKKLKRGMRVQAVWRPQEKRIGQISDIECFEVLWGEPIRKMGRATAPNDMEPPMNPWDLPPMEG